MPIAGISHNPCGDVYLLTQRITDALAQNAAPHNYYAFNNLFKLLEQYRTDILKNYTNPIGHYDRLIEQLDKAHQAVFTLHSREKAVEILTAGLRALALPGRFTATATELGYTKRFIETLHTALKN